MALWRVMQMQLALRRVLKNCNAIHSHVTARTRAHTPPFILWQVEADNPKPGALRWAYNEGWRACEECAEPYPGAPQVKASLLALLYNFASCFGLRFALYE